MTRRGPYAKGVAKRQEILDAALSVIGREGYSHATVKQIADEVGLSQNGMLHYFDSKDALFLEVLKLRDDLDSLRVVGRETGTISISDDLDSGELRERLLGLLRHNAEIAGLITLFMNLAVEASEPSHPFQAYFADRYRTIRELGSALLGSLQRAGQVRDDIDVAQAATSLIAMLDGLQLQWMYDPTLDMAAHLDAHVRLLRPAGPPAR